jgi:hypothetical protein
MDLLPQYPPYQTRHRRFQQWVRSGVLDDVLQALARDLEERGKIDLSECFIDGTFVVAKKGAIASERPSGVSVQRSCWLQALLLFHSPSTLRVLRLMKSPLSGILWRLDSLYPRPNASLETKRTTPIRLMRRSKRKVSI